jgi:putative PIN family toxin of toxin-antitoxin system
MESRTVFDTNIWVCYFIGKKTSEIMKMTEKDVVLLHSTVSADELIEVLSRKKFEKYKLDISDLLLFYTNICELCHTVPEFSNCPDPKDNFLFDLALQGNAKYLISGDKTVLSTPAGVPTLKVSRTLNNTFPNTYRL